MSQTYNMKVFQNVISIKHTTWPLSTVNGRVKAFFWSIMVQDVMRHSKNTERNIIKYIVNKTVSVTHKAKLY